jgi:hypothetical protein
MRVDPERSGFPSPLDEAIVLDDVRLDQMMRWHGTDETSLPPAGTLKNLARDTVAALAELRAARDTIAELQAARHALLELRAARETIAELRAAMGRAFSVSDFRMLHEILLTALGPPPDERAQ